MEVTVEKRLNGVELHLPGVDLEGNPTESKITAVYWQVVVELGMSDKKYLNLKPYMTAEQILQIEHALELAEQAVQAHG